MSSSASKKIRVFLPDVEQIWLTADLLGEVKPGHYEVEITDPDLNGGVPRRIIITMASLCRQMDTLPLQNDNVPVEGVPDMVNLNYLHEPSILENLRCRFLAQRPYTYVGIICIAVNPYQWLDGIYTEKLQAQHLTSHRHELEPHVYATSAAAYRDLRDFGRPQSILVSGESGAGKTETVKIMLSHIAAVSGRRGDETVQRILEANPLLESFGNAKTLRNDNSSRFGKFIELQFSGVQVGAQLCGSTCSTYLLEKSRVVGQSPGERNYLIFYQLFAAPPDVRLAKLQLPAHMGPQDFAFLNRGDTQTSAIEGVTDAAQYLLTVKTLRHLGFGAETVDALQRLLMGVLYLGQVSFLGDADHSFIDPAKAATTATCCALLGVAPTSFYETSTVRRIAAGKEGMGKEGLVVNLSREQALDGRDALAKEMYDRLFRWIVRCINRSTCSSLHPQAYAQAHGQASANSQAQAGASTLTESSQVVALLDIFGFEVFRTNRFEQLFFMVIREAFGMLISCQKYYCQVFIFHGGDVFLFLNICNCQFGRL